MKYLCIFLITCSQKHQIQYLKKDSQILFKQKAIEILDSEVDFSQLHIKEITSEYEKEELLLDLLSSNNS